MHLPACSDIKAALIMLYSTHYRIKKVFACAIAMFWV